MGAPCAGSTYPLTAAGPTRRRSFSNRCFGYAHTRFRFPWKWNGEEAVLQSRCTDERGEVQPTIAEAAKNLGVTPEYFYEADHFNGIQPWKVNRDGSIQNALV